MSNNEHNLDELEKDFQTTKRMIENFNIYKLFEERDIPLIIKLERLDKDAHPLYNIIITADRRITYNGIENVSILGRRESTLNQEQLMRIMEELEDVYFFSLHRSYLSKTTQLSSNDLIRISNDEKRSFALK